LTDNNSFLFHLFFLFWLTCWENRNFGRVYKATSKADNATVAIKILPVNEDDEDSVEKITKEIQMLKECSSPYITEYFGSYLKDGNLWVRLFLFLVLFSSLQKRSFSHSSPPSVLDCSVVGDGIL
jgi:serine/threonine protein kinase